MFSARHLLVYSWANQMTFTWHLDHSRPLALSRRSTSAARVLDDVTQAKISNRQWKHAYRKRVIATDAAIILVVVAFAQFARFGLPIDGADHIWFARASYSAALIITWLVALAAQQSWDPTLTSTGSDEYRRVALASAWVFGIIAATALTFQLYPLIARGFLLIVLPLGSVALLLGRYSLRRDLAKKRAAGQFSNNVVVLGTPRSIADFCQCISRERTAGYQIIGACIAGPEGAIGDEVVTPIGAIPVLGVAESIENALRLTNADTLAVTATEHLGYEGMRTLSWQLDTLKVDLIVAPGMTDVAGPRLKIRPIDNLPLFHIARSRQDAPSRIQKRVFDLTLGSVALLALLPVMLLAALAIKLDDGGPIFFRQDRVGFRSAPFRIYKFRTMLVDSDERKTSEQAARGQDNVIFYKSASDSRITRVGRFLRRTSIDEIPQLLNVIGGAMSLVGPRPLVPGEGRSVQYFVERRALVKPGMTGLWQVSGRSDVSAEERIRLDHSYVDNWSPVQDLVILCRTLQAVLNRQGAY